VIRRTSTENGAPVLARRVSNRAPRGRRGRPPRSADPVRPGTWDEQRAQHVTRFLFAALGLAYFNIGAPTARDADYLLAINVVHLVYFALTALYLLHARARLRSPLRLRVAMWTDILGVSAAALADVSPMAPAYLVYLVIVLGNGMRYGLRAFAEAALGSLAAAIVVLGLRFPDYLQNLSVASVLFILFIGIIVAYSYALMKNIERARQWLEQASGNDALTGLLNRRGLHERTEAMFKALAGRAPPLAVLFADLDGFKAVNDSHAHDAGDRLLKDVARALAASVRGVDIVARFGGDEFVVIMPETHLDQAAAVARRIQAIVSTLGGKGSRLSLTIGIGSAPADGADLDAVLKSVDAAMYQAKLAACRGGICRVDGVAVAA
jgi:diguanylate cyclase (GGDEF)-like protein